MRPTVLLTHDTDALRDYYGAAALEGLRAIAQVRLNPADALLSTAALIDAAAGCRHIVADVNTPVEAAAFAALPDLVAVHRCAVDVRTIDIEAASRAGVLVTNAGPGFVDAVTELTLGLIVDLARGITRAAASYRAGAVPEKRMGLQLSGATLGILGYGAIGARLGTVARALGMRVLAADPHKTIPTEGIEQAPMETVLAEADIVVCLVVATPETESLMDAAAFARMRPSAFFVNMSRGNLVDEAALAAALDAGRIAGAALDVGRAPGQMPSPALAARPDVIATPHIGGLTPAATAAQALETVEQVRALAEGRLPHNALNAERAGRLARLGIKGGKA